MPRVKRGVAARRRRNRVLQRAKGYYGTRHSLFKTAREAVEKGWKYAYRDRRQRKREMRALGSVLLASADTARVAAGSALAVDRHLFADAMTSAIESEAAIEVVREECAELPEGPAVVATGPLTSDALSTAIESALGDGGLSFFDAIAPIVHRDSLDETVVFAAGRFDEDADYLNCPMSREEYEEDPDQSLRPFDVFDGWRVGTSLRADIQPAEPHRLSVSGYYAHTFRRSTIASNSKSG